MNASILHIFRPLFDKGGLSNFVPYFLKVSIFRASLELFKTTQNFYLSERAWDEIVIFPLSQPIFFEGVNLSGITRAIQNNPKF